MRQCKKCGGNMIGDGYKSVMQCEFAEVDLDVEADAGPIYCDFKEQYAGHLSTVYVYADGWAYSEPSPINLAPYEERKGGFCLVCDSSITPHYREPFASCKCGSQEWYF